MPEDLRHIFMSQCKGIENYLSASFLFLFLLHVLCQTITPMIPPFFALAFKMLLVVFPPLSLLRLCFLQDNHVPADTTKDTILFVILTQETFVIIFSACPQNMACS